MAVAVVHVVSSLGPEAAGLSQAVRGMSHAAATQTGLPCWIVTRNEPRAAHAGSEDMTIVPVRGPWPASWRQAVHQALASAQAERRRAIVHVHGLWRPELHWAVCEARAKGLPFALQPHGMLEPWALTHKGLKKRLAMRLYQRRDLEAAPLLVATAEAEYRAFRAQGLRNPVAIIPLGIDRVDEETSSHRANPEERHLLFLSRIHPVKGLLDLIRAWARVSPAYPQWRLAIAGPDEGGHLAKVLALAKSSGVAQSVRYLGMLQGEAKAAALRSADLFVLPTYSENFGLVVLEALAHGLPVITTRAAPWEDLLRHRCGWWTDVGVVPLTEALREAMSLSDEARKAMGVRAKACAAQYAWGSIAQRMAEAYEWVLGQCARPSFVLLD